VTISATFYSVFFSLLKRPFAGSTSHFTSTGRIHLSLGILSASNYATAMRFEKKYPLTSDKLKCLRLLLTPEQATVAGCYAGIEVRSVNAVRP
jgi:hypothetical protein